MWDVVFASPPSLTKKKKTFTDLNLSPSIYCYLVSLCFLSLSFFRRQKKCGSKFDRIITDKLSFKSSKKTLGAGDTVTIDTSGTNMLHTTFMGGSWSVRVYEEGWAHPVGDFTGDLSKVMTFPDAKNTTFDINGVTFDLPGETIHSSSTY